jgi:hypothetical protein
MFHVGEKKEMENRNTFPYFIDLILFHFEWGFLLQENIRGGKNYIHINYDIAWKLCWEKQKRQFLIF